MMARIRKSMEEKDQGFTLIELLVVMIIIGILAAIAVPVFLNQRAKARETAAKSDVTSINKDVQAFYVDGSGALTVSGPVSVTPPGGSAITNGYSISSGATVIAGGRLSEGVKVLSGNVVSATSYCVSVQSNWTSGATSSSDQVWKVTQDGLAKGTC